MSEQAAPGAARTTTRRRFLGLTVGGLAALALLPRCGGGEEASEADGGPPEVPDPPDPPDPPDLPEASPFELDELLDAYFGAGSRADVEALGAAWTRTFGDDRGRLTEEMAALASQLEGVGSAVEAADRLRAALLEDFGALRLADAGGWQLGLTEARLVGLAYALSA